MTHPTPAEVTAAERRPVHGGYPDATPSMRQRPIMLEIAKASDEHERRTTEWASFIATGACADLPDLIDYIAQMNGWPTLSRAARHRLAADRGGERERKAVALDAYDAGLLSDFGGGNVEWWQDYIRAELERAHDHYEAQFLTLASTPPADRGQGVPEGWRLVPVEADDNIAEAIAMTANCCGGIAADIWNAALSALPAAPNGEA